MTTEPVRILSFGAGVQSTTILLMMIHGELPKAEHIVFSDTGWEPDEVYVHLAKMGKLIEENDMKLHIVSQGNIKTDFLDDAARFASMPLHIRSATGKKGMLRRQCTGDYKLKPLMTKQRELAGLRKSQRSKEHLLTTVIGISYDESQRMRDPFFNWNKHDYPLVDNRITRQDCIDWCADKGYDRPPRSACIGCPYKSDEEWRHLRTMEKEWKDAVEFDKALRNHEHIKARFNGEAYLHQSLKPLDEADLRSKEETGIFSLFDQECQGMCGN
jgi:3'-phosphoadenosine 5'-phosphosulfate sulfotransferase (PAPS reductase)/FAD synthetase